MVAAINQVLTLVLIIVVGFIAARVKIIDSNTRSHLSELLLLICTPMQVLHSFQIDYTQELARNMALLALIGFVGFGASFLVGMAVWRKQPEDKRRVLWLSTMLCNCGYMGIPVFKGVFGDVGVIYAAIFVVVFTVYSWTAGIHIMGVSGGSWKNIVLQPALIACAIGFVLFFTRWQLPEVVNQVLSNVGNMTTPLAMIVTGSLIADMEPKGIFGDKTIFPMLALRLLIFPAVVFGVLTLLGLPQDMIKAGTLIFAMPIATNVVLFATRYDKAPHFAGTLTVVSTILSMVTLAFWIAIL